MAEEKSGVKKESGNRNLGCRRRAQASATRAAALIEREELLNAELQVVKQLSRRLKIEAELSKIRRGLQLLGFHTTIAGDRSS